MAKGPMAKHPSARRRGNAPATTAREIVLRQPGEPLRPVPALPQRRRMVDETDDKGKTLKVLREVEWHSQAAVAWAELWQFPLVYQAPDVDSHLLEVYVALIDDFWHKLEAGKAITEQANQIRAFSELWGIGEKSRRHLQITIQEAEEAIERGTRQHAKRVESEAGLVLLPSSDEHAPSWSDDDEDDGSIINAEIVE